MGIVNSLTLDRAQGLGNKNVAPTPWLGGKKCIKRLLWKIYDRCNYVQECGTPVRKFDTFSETCEENELNLTQTNGIPHTSS